MSKKTLWRLIILAVFGLGLGTGVLLRFAAAAIAAANEGNPELLVVLIISVVLGIVSFFYPR